MVKDLAYWLEWIRAYHDQATEYSLDNIGLVARQLNLTSFDIPVIVVGGTNGKGSCVASMEAILLAHGYKVGAFTSPHLHKFNERIRINGSNISDAKICSIMQILYDCLANNKFIPLRFFDYATLIALLAFKQATVDFILLEVGLGGRLDAVNVVEHAISIITSISLDHCEWLGASCEAIAREKAGIVHKGGCLIYAEENLPTSVAEVVFEQQAQLLHYGKDYCCKEGLNSWGWHKGSLEFLNLPKPSFPVQNAAAAICALSQIPWLQLKQNILQQVFNNLKVPGRLQIEQYCGRELVFDVAHNPAAVAWLSAKVQAMPRVGKTVVLLAIAATKDYVSMLQFGNVEPIIGCYVLYRVCVERLHWSH